MFYSASTNGFYTTEIHGDNIPGDAVEITETEHAALLEGQSQGKVIVADENGRPILQDPPPPTLEQIMSRLTDRVQLWLDEQARALGYDDIRSAVTYAEEPAVPKFQRDGQALRRLRSLARARYYEILNEVQAGQRSIPTEEELIAELEALKGVTMYDPSTLTDGVGLHGISLTAQGDANG